MWDNIMRPILSTLPNPDVSGTGMDDGSDGGIKGVYSLSMPNISETLMMWYASQGFIGYQMCAILAQHWLINKACTMPARDAIRQGFEIISADGEKLPTKILQEIKQHDDAFGLAKNLVEFVRKGRIFGVRLLYFKIDSPDPDYYSKPFNIDGVRPGSYKGIVQVDPYWVSPILDLPAATDPDSINFYEPTWWQINGKKIHRSHLMIFRNSEVVDLLKPSYLYGGVPVPQQIMERVYAAERTANEGPLLAMTKRTTVYSTNIQKAFANKAQFDERMMQWMAMRDNQQIKLADKNADEVQQFDTTLTGLSEIIMDQYQIVAAAANVPATKLLGTTPKGFNATGEYEESSYHEELESIQTHDLTPVVRRHHQLLIKSHVGPKFGVVLDVRAEWNPVDSPTAAEEAEINNKKSQTAKNWFDVGSIDGYDGREYLINDRQSGFTFMEAVQRPEEFKPGDTDPNDPQQEGSQNQWPTGK